MNIINLESVSPAYNLAVEEALFESLHHEDESFFLLWQNTPSVIIGRHQNTAEEVNEAYVRDHDITVIRRLTGGGAVYHDLGNLNFSFLHFLPHNADASFTRFITPIIHGLRTLGFNAEQSGRNDILIDGKKVSGNAQKRSGAKFLQHGTIMLNLDVSHLSRILTGNSDKFISKGIASHKSRVANLLEFAPHSTPEKLMNDIKTTLMQCCGHEKVALPECIHEQALELVEKRYSTWAWNFGKSPAHSVKFRSRFTWGAVEFSANIKHGHVVDCHFHGDFFVHKDVSALEQTFINIPYTQSDMLAMAKNINMFSFFIGATEHDLDVFFRENIF